MQDVINKAHWVSQKTKNEETKKLMVGLLAYYRKHSKLSEKQIKAITRTYDDLGGNMQLQQILARHNWSSGQYQEIIANIKTITDLAMALAYAPRLPESLRNEYVKQCQEEMFLKEIKR